MRFAVLPVRCMLAVLVMAILLVSGMPLRAMADEDAFRIGAHVILDDQWTKYTTAANQSFVATLRAKTASGTIDTLPSDRLYQLYRAHQLDCILTGGWPHDDPQLTTKRALMFEVRLFTRADFDLGVLDEILVGRMKQFPPPALPFEKTMIDWLPLQNLQQGFDLLRAGRVDALLADPSHVQNDADCPQAGIVPANLPPVRQFGVPLLCHDTEGNRTFVKMLDQESLTQ